jgi:hypothetical protein
VASPRRDFQERATGGRINKQGLNVLEISAVGNKILYNNEQMMHAEHKNHKKCKLHIFS